MKSRTIQESDVGRIARVRQRHYLIDEVQRSDKVRTTVARLSCIDPDDLGKTLDVIWEAECDAEVRPAEDWGLIAGGDFDPTDRFAAYYHTLRWNRVTASRTDLFQAPFRAGISIEHYQLEPLRMALAMLRVNLFIADGVGLGKTIEAGLVARELLLRRKVSDIVVSCPPSMLLQWREEMESRFGLIFQILDRAYVHRIRKERGFSINPWATHNRFLISHNLIKDEEYAADLRAWLGRDLVRPRSLLILDEAHHAAPSAAGAYAVTSQFTRRIEEIAPRFEHKIFLSATPHNGHSNSFRALMAILDPQRFCRGVPIRARERNEVLIYRLKDDLRDLNVSFPRREVQPVRISAPVNGTPELELADWLQEYCDLRDQRLASEPQKIKNASDFLKSGLQKRLLSSVEAFYRTLSKHNRTLRNQLRQHEQGSPPLRPLDLDDDALSAIGGGLDPDAEPDEIPDTDPETSPEDPKPADLPDHQDAEVDRQTEKATLGNPDHTNFDRELKLLDRMLHLAERARYQPDEKLKAILDYIRLNMLVSNDKRPPSGTTTASSSSPSPTIPSLTFSYICTNLSKPPTAPISAFPSSRAAPRSKTARRSRKPSTPPPPSTPSASSSPPTPPERALTSRSTAPTSSTTTSSGTPPGPNRATAASTASSSPPPSSTAATSSTRTARKTPSSKSSSRKPSASTGNSAASAPSSTSASSTASAAGASNAHASRKRSNSSTTRTPRKNASPLRPAPRSPETTTTPPRPDARKSTANAGNA